MVGTTSRALALLNLLQTHRHWPGAELAERLGVTQRTVRRDVERLRELGYRIESTPGVAGGYRLEAGSAVPPLLLTDDEATAMAVGLRLAAEQRLIGGPETTLTALAKLEQVLPAPLRRRVNALAGAIRPSGVRQGAPVSSEVLGELALACRDHERLRFGYTSMDGSASDRRVEPYVLAPASRNWYLLCWDLDRDDWRTFRVDRIAEVQHARFRFEPKPLTPEQVAEFIQVATTWTPQALEAAAVMDLPLEAVRERFGQWSQGAEAVGAKRTRWPVGGTDFRDVMYALSWIPAGVHYSCDLGEPARGELAEVLGRMLNALSPQEDLRPPQ